MMNPGQINLSHHGLVWIPSDSRWLANWRRPKAPQKYITA